LTGANPSFLHHEFNTLGLTVTDNGRIAFADTAHTQGRGLEKNGSATILQEAGLALVFPDGSVTDALTGDQDFLAQNGFPNLEEKNVFRDETVSRYTATASSLNVDIEERVIGRRNAPHQNYLAIQYTITNTNSVTLDSLAVGLFLDWYFEAATLEEMRYYAATDFAYASDGRTLWATKVLGGATQYQPIEAGGINDWTDGFTDAEKRDLLREGIGLPVLQNADAAQMIGKTLFNIAPNEERTVTFVITSSTSIRGVELQFEQAEIAFFEPISRSPVPVLNPILCPTDENFARVQPSGGTNFKLYRQGSYLFPEQAGRSFTVLKTDYGKPFYITCTDSLLESDPIEVHFSEKPMTADFVAPDTFDITSGADIRFLDNSPTNAVAWRWDFGDGRISTRENPSHSYIQEGYFEVTLTITDTEGCQKSITKPLQIIRQGPVPRLQNSYTSCANTPIRLAPENGSLFRFYANYPNTPLGDSSIWVIDNPDLEEVWITNLDSSLESTPRRVTLNWKRLIADFTPNPGLDTLIASDIQFTDESEIESAIITRLWDFGDGTSSTDVNPLHNYLAQGIYEVSLFLEDALGCTSERKAEFRVGKRAPIPILSSPRVICRDNETRLTPTGGTLFRFYEDDSLQNLIFEGGSYTFTPDADTPNLIFVTCVDSIIESYPLEVQLNQRNPFVDFEFNRELFLDENDQVQFTDRSERAIAWAWDFGDGSTSNVQNPVHRYTYESTFSVNLEITTAEGCIASASKNLLAFRRSPSPDLEDIQICQGDRAVLEPLNGADFRFYATDNSNSEPLFEGKRFITPPLLAPTTYYIKNFDSTLESFWTRVDITFSKPSAAFAQGKDTLNLKFEESIQFISTSVDAVQWYWDFGDGTTSNIPNPTAQYDELGEYEVRLIVRDVLGCLDTAQSKLLVIDTLISNLPLNEGKQFNLKTFPNPTSGELNVQLLLRDAAQVEINLYNAVGQLIYQPTAPRSQRLPENNYNFTLNLASFPRGLYLLVLNADGLLIQQKIILR
ncbi:MAG: PKD domain-containing protein, partial [Bacteroidota bacterium]